MPENDGKLEEYKGLNSDNLISITSLSFVLHNKADIPSSFQSLSRFLLSKNKLAISFHMTFQ